VQVEGVGALPAMPGVVDSAVSLACSTLLSGAAADALKSFFRSLQHARPAPAFEQLRSQLLSASADVPRSAQRSCCECAAALCEGSQQRVADTMRLAISELEKANTVRRPPLSAHACSKPTQRSCTALIMRPGARAAAGVPRTMLLAAAAGMRCAVQRGAVQRLTLLLRCRGRLCSA
jgi:hypothetical protein